MARKFLYVIAGVIGLVLLLALGYRFMESQLWQMAFVPDTDFAEQAPPPAPDYAKPQSWAFYATGQTDAAVDIFYIHPTTHFDKSTWNAALDDESARMTLNDLVLPNQGAVFEGVGRVFAPRYRQATLGAFMVVESDNAQKAFALGYGDVLAAFDHYLAHENQGRPFILAAHSQGSYHGLQLLRDRITAQGLAHHMVAAYLVGWTISIEADLDAIGLEPCIEPDLTGCAVTWQSYEQGGEPKNTRRIFVTLAGLMGASREGTTMLCVNPISWRMDLELAVGNPSAQCGDDGILYLQGSPPALGGMVLPGGNYHVYDIDLFRDSLIVNLRQRIAAYGAR